MAKTWVLDTETKGTGAHIAPLSDRRTDAPEAALALVQLARPPRPAAPGAPSAERQLRFKLIDVRSGQALLEGADAPATVRALARMRSALDARVYVWSEERRRWRLLSLADTRTLWELATRGAAQQ